jgi:quinol monooxygenase YgiN
MLIRLVRMTFAPDTVEAFLDRFEQTAPQIRAFPGCHHLELWRDADAPAVFTTHSHWESEEALEQYRHSDLFQSTWSDVKPLFDARPRAHSYTVAHPAQAIDEAVPADGK